MVALNKKQVIAEFKKIPGIGPSIANDFWLLGLRSPAELKNQDPEKLYLRLCQIYGCQLDRCLLYAFRCAVYFVSQAKHQPELLKWWSWKDRPNKL